MREAEWVGDKSFHSVLSIGLVFTEEDSGEARGGFCASVWGQRRGKAVCENS